MSLFDSGGTIRSREGRPLARVRTVAVTAAVYVVLSVFPGRFVLSAGHLSVAPAEGVSLVAALLAGPFGAVGGAVGYIVVDGVTDSLAPATAFGAAGRLLLGLVGYRLWWRTMGRPPRLTTVRDALAFAVAAVLGVMTGTAVVGWGYVVLGQAPFFVATVLEFPALFVATVSVGGPVLAFTTWLREGIPDPSDHRRVDHSGLLIAPVLWYLSGTGLSMLLQMYQVVPATALQERGLGWVRILEHGRLIQIGLGLVLFCVLTVVLVGLDGTADE